MSKSNLLLLHGALGASDQFHALSKLLAEYYAIHTFDFEGHGRAPSRDRPFRIEYFAENIASYLDNNNLRDAHVFGYSMGGYAALYLALVQPERMKKIATLGTKFRWDIVTARKESSALDPRAISEKLPRFAEVLAQRHVAAGWEKVLERTAEMMLNLGQRPLLTPNELRKIQQRVRIGIGDRDSMVSIEESIEVYHTLPHGEIMMFPNTHHPFERVPLQMLVPSLVEFFR